MKSTTLASKPFVLYRQKAYSSDYPSATDAGKWRQGSVGIIRGSKVTHVAPQAHRVSQLMASLFTFLKEDKATLSLIKACIFHYELEFNHPFSDGNGRMGRFWQRLLLLKENSIFAFIPVESIVKERQQDNYRALRIAEEIRLHLWNFRSRQYWPA